MCITIFHPADGGYDPRPHRWLADRCPGQPDTAIVKCSNGHLIVLDQHKIAEDGMVTPKVACPKPGCGFDEHIQLALWYDRVDGIRAL